MHCSETHYHAVANFLQFCRYLSSDFYPYAILYLKDTEPRTSRQDSQKTVEEPQEPISPEARERESNQVMVIHLCLGCGVVLGTACACAVRSRGRPGAEVIAERFQHLMWKRPHWH